MSDFAELAQATIDPAAAALLPLEYCLEKKVAVVGAAGAPGPLAVSTGADTRRAWIRIVSAAPVRLSPALRSQCRAALKSQGGALRSDARGATMSFGLR